MKKLRAFIYLITFISFSQQNWNPLGPNDYNNPSNTRVNKSKMICKNDNIYVLNIAYTININIYNGEKWEELSTPFNVNNINETVDITVDDSNNIYICYTEVNYPIKKLTVKKYNGINWTTIGDTEVNMSDGSFSKILFHNNEIFIYYQDILNNYKTSVKKFNGINWEYIGLPGFSSASVDNTSTSFCLDNNNKLIVSYKEYINSNIFIKKFDGNNWINLGNINTTCNSCSINNISNSQIAFDSNNNLYFAYTDSNNNNRINVKKYNGIEWTTIGYSIYRGIYVSIAVNNNIPYIVYTALDNNYYPYQSFKIEKFNGLNFENYPINFLGFETVNTYYNSILFKNNIPYISYCSLDDSNLTKVRRLSGENWEILGEDPIITGNYLNPCIKLDNNNNIYLSYRDINNSNKISVKKYINNQWEYVGLPGFSNAEIFNSLIRIDNNNVPYVIYVCNNKIVVQRYNGLEWEIVGSDLNETSNGFDLSFNNLNIPHIVYRGGGSMADNPRCSVRKFNGINWELVGNAHFSNIEANSPKISFDINTGYPIVSYYSSNYELSMKRFDGNNWLNFHYGLYFNGTNFIKDNIPYVAYKNDLQNISVKKFINGYWQLVGNDNFSSSNILNPKIIINNNNIPYVFYLEKDVIVPNNYYGIVKKFNGNSWVTVGNSKVTANPVEYLSFDVKDDLVIVAYSGNSGNCGLYAKYFGETNFLNLNNKENKKEELIIYPNPVENIFYIKDSNFIDEIEIYDLVGKCLLKQNNIKNELNIEYLPTGYYTVKIKSQNHIYLVKIIKK